MECRKKLSSRRHYYYFKVTECRYYISTSTFIYKLLITYFKKKEIDIGCRRSGTLNHFREIAESLEMLGGFVCEFEEIESNRRDKKTQVILALAPQRLI